MVGFLALVVNIVFVTFTVSYYKFNNNICYSNIPQLKTVSTFSEELKYTENKIQQPQKVL